MPAPSQTRVTFRLAAVVAVCLSIVLAMTALGSVVWWAFGSIAETADNIDDARAADAANGAVDALRKQLGATVRDNAYWDLAYTTIPTAEGAAWATDGWVRLTRDYPLYDTALVIKPDDGALVASHLGEVITDVDTFFGGKLDEIVAAARRLDRKAERLPVAFIKTSSGLAIIGAAPIQPSAAAAADDFDYAGSHVLVLSKHFTPEVIEEIAKTFGIAGLTLAAGGHDERALYAEIEDIEGTELARFTWPPVRPGTTSYISVRPVIMAAGAGFVLLVMAVAASGLVSVRAVRLDERASKFKATHDALTGLWNRMGCLERLDADLRSSTTGQVSLHILDLDGFKAVNDAWGHPVGDELVKAVADRLLAALPDEALIARLGGDEFAVVHVAGHGKENDGSLGARMVEALHMPFMIGGRTIEVGGSVGTALVDGRLDAAEMLRRADLALYRAKAGGRGICVIYDASLDDDASRNAELEQELRAGITRKEVWVAFQPLIDASTREISGVEALARWSSPTRGPISPEVFIDLAERAGLIDQLGFEVLRTAVAEASNWPRIGISVNISPLQLRNPYFVGQVAEILTEARFDPARLTVEVTEGVLISNPAQAKRAFEAFHNLGVKIALDDFGCGYASIGALRAFGFDRMKIDRSLILALDRDQNGGAVLNATIALANALHLPVTAEGIETEEQASAVRISGCDKLQGYLFSKPLPAAQITARYFSVAPERTLVG